jgi:hypothetical protein
MPPFELTLPQARAAAALRRRWPDGIVTPHPRPYGVILEVQIGAHSVDRLALLDDGTVLGDVPLPRAA